MNTAKSVWIGMILGLTVGLAGSSVAHEMNMAAAPSTPAGAALNESMAVMDKTMMATQQSGDADVDFATMMIPHHQGAVDMAKVELLYGKNPVLRRLAQEIIVTQSSEIAVMHTALEHSAPR